MRIIGFSHVIRRSRRFVKVIWVTALLLAANPLGATAAPVASLPAQVGTVTWTGAGDGIRWSNRANWDAGRLPGPNDVVRLGPAPAGAVIDGTFVGVIAGLKIDAGFQGTLRLKQPLRITGDLDMQGGVLDGGFASLWVNGAVRVNGGMLITPRAVMHVNSLDIQAPGVVQMGSRGKLNLAGNGTPLSGNGLLDVTTNRPNSVEFTGKTTSSLDLAGPVSALQSIHISASAMQRLAAGRAISAPRAPNAPLFAEYGSSLTLNGGEDNLSAAVIDAANGYAYFGTFTSSGIIIKVDLATFQRVGALTLDPGEDILTSAVLDDVDGFAYFGTATAPGIVVKIDLSTFTRASAVTLDVNLNQYPLTSAVIDTGNGFAYFGTSNTSPANIIRIALNGANLPTYDGMLTLNPGEENLLSAVIDTANGQAYFGTLDTSAANTASVIQVDLANFNRAGALALNQDENGLGSAVIDTANNAAYFATSTSPINIVKVQLSPLSRVGAIQPFSTDYNLVYAGVIDASKGYAYFGAQGSPSVIAKVRISPGFTTVQTITLPSGEDFIASAVLDPNQHYAYFGTTNSPGVIVRVALLNAQTTLTSTVNPSVYGQSVTFTATVIPIGTPGTPTGVVTFSVDSGPNVTRTLTSGIAAYTPASLTVGTHFITATYGGTAVFDIAGGTLTQIVSQASTTTTLSSSVNPSSYGQGLTFTATVTSVAPGSGTPTGPLTFIIDGTPIVTPTLNAGGVATYTTSTLAAGAHTVNALYGGSTSYISSTGSLTTSQTVNKAGTLETITSSSNPAVFGQTVTFTTIVSVVAPAAGTPTGVVTITIDGNVIATPTLGSNRVATFTTSSLIVGTHTVSVTFSGDANYSGGSAAIANGQVINKANSTVSVASSANPSYFGQPVTFTAAVTPVSPGGGAVAPSGTVNFTVDGIVAGSGTLSGGVATMTLNATTMAVGAHTISAIYSGDASFNGSAGNLAASQRVSKTNTTAGIVSSANPSIFGQAITFTVTITPVAPGAGAPSGVVTFTIDNAVVGTSGVSGGVATYVTQTLVVGTHAVTATYGGDANFNIGTATLASGQIVNKANTSTTIASSVNASVYGQSVTFTATVAVLAPSGTVLSGSVNFMVDGVIVLTPTLSGGVALFTTSALPAGTHAISATYAGTTSINGSTATLSPDQTVNNASTATSVGSSANPSVYGQVITFTAVVSLVAPSTGTPQGVMNFIIDSNLVSAPTISGGVAQYVTTTLSAGTHTVSAVYGGNLNVFGSIGNLAGDQIVNKANTTVTVTSTVNPSVYGQAVTFTTTVKSVAPSVATPTGPITVSIDGASPVALTLSNGVAAYTTSTLTIGAHRIVATYDGAANFNGSTASLALSQTVAFASTTTSVASSLTPAVFGDEVAFTATVTAVLPGAGTPTGVVTFTIDGALSTIATLSNGAASMATSVLTKGLHTVVVAYGGDGQFKTSTGSLTPNQQVVGASTTTSVDASANTTVYGQAAAFTATVSSVAGTPTGIVSFTVDGVAGSTLAPLNGNIAAFSTTLIPGGTHTVTALYLGTADYGPSTGSITHTVSKTDTTTSVDTSANPTLFGEVVTFTAVVTPVAPGSGTVGGTVNFIIDGSLAGSGDLSGGVATFTSTSLTIGTHTITATYAGDNNFNGSSGSLAPDQGINPADSATTVDSSANPSIYGQSVTFTATVSAVAPSIGTPTGLITFSVDGIPVSSPYLGDGIATYVISILPVGTHTIEVIYEGDPGFSPSGGSLTVSQTVNVAGTTTSIASLKNPSIIGESAHFTVTVAAPAPSSGTPSGMVTITLDNGVVATPVLFNGEATFTAPSLTVGQHIVTASYSGDGSYDVSSGVLTQTVNRPAATITITSSQNPSVYGQTVTFTAIVTSAAGTPTGAVTITVDGAPLTTQSVDAGGRITVATSALPTGNHTVTAQYSGNANFNTGVTTLAPSQVVNKASTTTAMALSANPVMATHAVTFTAMVAVVSPGAGAPGGVVTFTINGAPVGTSSLTGASATYITSTLPAGAYTVTATYGGDVNFAQSVGTLNPILTVTPLYGIYLPIALR